MNLGQIYLGMGQYDKAIEILSSVRQRSRDWVTRRTVWEVRTGRRAETWNGVAMPRVSQAEAQKAIDVLNVALKARRDANVGPTDPGSGRQRRRPGDRAYRDRQAGRGAETA